MAVSGASLGERPHDVPLAGDPVDRGAVGRDDHGTDPVLGQYRQQLAHRRVRGDCDNSRALDAK